MLAAEFGIPRAWTEPKVFHAAKRHLFRERREHNNDELQRKIAPDISDNLVPGRAVTDHADHSHDSGDDHKRQRVRGERHPRFRSCSPCEHGRNWPAPDEPDCDEHRQDLHDHGAVPEVLVRRAARRIHPRGFKGNTNHRDERDGEHGDRGDFGERPLPGVVGLVS